MQQHKTISLRCMKMAMVLHRITRKQLNFMNWPHNKESAERSTVWEYCKEMVTVLVKTFPKQGSCLNWLQQMDMRVQNGSLVCCTPMDTKSNRVTLKPQSGLPRQPTFVCPGRISQVPMPLPP